MINQGGSDLGLPICAARTGLPVVQDTQDKDLWNALGASYDSLLVVGPGGLLAGRILRPVFPGVVPQLEALVDPLLPAP